LRWLGLLSVAAFSAAIGVPAQSVEPSPLTTVHFGDDLTFVRHYTQAIVLTDVAGKAQIAVVPAWQGRVLTSSALGKKGLSFGWINRKLIASRATLTHFNPLGGEDRLWLGPEGGQFSIYFAKGAPFDLEHWYVPKALDTLPFHVRHTARDSLSLEARFALKNYSGTPFQVLVNREVRILEPGTAWQALGVQPREAVSLVAYESRNTLTNAGARAWKKDTGLLSLWVLGMFNPSEATTIVVPIKPGPVTELGKKVTSDYFGMVPSGRLKVTESAVFLRADGQFRSKVGINAKRSLAKLGSYDALHHALTIVQFEQPAGVTEYVNSLWKLQPDPFAGDAANAYNDGPPAAGVPPMGPFFELESSSPAAALGPGASISHTHRTIHLIGPQVDIDRIAKAVLGVSLAQIMGAFGG